MKYETTVHLGPQPVTVKAVHGYSFTDWPTARSFTPHAIVSFAPDDNSPAIIREMDAKGRLSNPVLPLPGTYVVKIEGEP